MDTPLRKGNGMAQKIEVTLVDDVDGTADDGIETVRFSVNGVPWEIDLNPENLAVWNKKIGFYIEHGRKAGSNGSAPARRRRDRSGTSRERSSDIRVWAKQQGHEISDRGRVPVAIIAEYDASH